MEVDLRSADPAALQDLDARFHAASSRPWPQENARWNQRGPVSASAELAGAAPAGQTARDSPIVQTALAVSRALEIEEVLHEGSHGFQLPMNLKIPAITIGGGGTGAGAHSLNETFRPYRLLARHQRALCWPSRLAR